MDIGSGKSYPANALSNFSPHPFIFDSVECNSMEGLLQSFKFDKIPVQIEVCKLIGIAAKKRGRKRNHNWQKVQRLWWNGRSYARDSKEYQELLDRAYQAIFNQSESFRKALKASKDSVLTHSIGCSKEELTVLTEREFCSRLRKLRDKL